MDWLVAQFLRTTSGRNPAHAAADKTFV